MSKKKILEYLQNNSWDLRKQFPTLVDVKYEAKPARMVLVFASAPPQNVENFTKVLDFKVEIKVEKEEVTQSVAGEDKNVAAWKKRHKSADLTKQAVEEVKEAVSPISKNAEKVEAYEAWKKRHSAVKVK